MAAEMVMRRMMNEGAVEEGEGEGEGGEGDPWKLALRGCVVV